MARRYSSAEVLQEISKLADGETKHFIFDVTVWNNSGRYMVRRGIGGVTLCRTAERAAITAVKLVNSARRQFNEQNYGARASSSTQGAGK